MGEKVYNVLFLCTGNSARSIMAKRLLEGWGKGRFRGFSAGSHPRDEVHPMALEILARNHYPIEGLRCKDWSEFAAPGAPEMEFVFTVCDKAAAEQCPDWHGRPLTANWGIADPTAEQGNEVARTMAFRIAFRELQNRISIFVNLPLASLDKLALQNRLDDIGRTRLDTEEAEGPLS